MPEPDDTSLVHLEERRPDSGLVVVPRTVVLAHEETLDRALVAMVGGTRPAVSTAMVSAYLFERFGITTLEADVRLHEPEDFVVRFRHRTDRDRVLAAPPGGHLLPLVWYLWRRTTMANIASFRYKVLIGMRRVPLHGRNVETA